MKSLKIRPQVFKHLDSNTELTINLISGIKEVQLNPEHSYKLKIKNNTGYLTEYDLEIKDNQLILTTDKLKDFTPDDYEVEVWDSYEDKDSIYPDEDYGTFKIDKNVSEVDGETIPVITIEDFEKRFAEAVKNAKGDKGDTGTIIWHAMVWAWGQTNDVPMSEIYAVDFNTNIYDRKPQINDWVYDGIDRELYVITSVNEEKETVNLREMANLGRGKSNYDIWLELGNKGTKQDYLDYIAAKSSKIERHAPTGWSLDISTKPWTVWFDNGVGLQFPDFYNNTTVHSDSVIGSLLKLSNNAFALTHSFKKVWDISNSFWDISNSWGNFKYYITSRTIVINPVNTKITDWDNRNYGIQLADSMPGHGGYPLYKAGDIVRVLYGLGIVNDAILESMDKTMPDEYTWIDKWS